MQHLSNEQLLKQTIEAAANERRALIEIIRCFAEIDRPKLYATNHSSMFEYATRELKMSEGQAQRRIDAARLYREIPEIAERITKGTINLMHLSLARKFQRHEKRAKRTPDLRELLQELEGKSTR